jgi:hypothetical protein
MTTTTQQATQETVALSARDLTKTYGRGEAQVHALRGIDLDLPRGRFDHGAERIGQVHWVGYETFVKQALRHATMQLPWLSLGVVVLIAALAGLLACVLPARRAARVTPAAGLSLD